MILSVFDIAQLVVEWLPAHTAAAADRPPVLLVVVEYSNTTVWEMNQRQTDNGIAVHHRHHPQQHQTAVTRQTVKMRNKTRVSFKTRLRPNFAWSCYLPEKGLIRDRTADL